MRLRTYSRRLKFWFNLLAAYFSRYRFRLITSILLSTLIVIIATHLWPSIIRSNIVTIGYVGNYTISNIPQEVLYLATKPLITVDNAGKPVPSLASHWTVADDGKTYIVFLKDNLRWHNDTTVDARDITIAIDNVQITGLNNKTIKFELKNPVSSFPTILNKPVFKKDTFYGAGEFRIVDIDEVQGVIKKMTLVPKNPDLPKVFIKFYPTENQLASALKIGEVKAATVNHAKLFENWPNLKVERISDTSDIVTIFFNTNDSSLFSKEFRQSLIFALNRAQFDGILATGPIAPANWTYTQEVKKYEYNTGKAKELLAKSEIRNPKITLSTTQDLENQASQIKKDWEDIGISVEINVVNQIPSNFQALLAINKIPPDPDQYGLWHSTQTSSNLTGLKDVRIDKLLEDARTTHDEEKRREFYTDFQKSLVEEAPAAFLYHPYKYYVVYKNNLNILSKLPK